MAVIQGKVKWASVQSPNETYEPAWQVDVVLEDMEEAKALREQGLNVKKDKDGDVILKLKQSVYRKDGVTRNKAPRVVDADKEVFLDLIGNGSLCNVQYNVRPWEYKGKTGVAGDLRAVQVLELVPYDNADKDEFDVVEGGTQEAQAPAATEAPADDFDDDLPF